MLVLNLGISLLIIMNFIIGTLAFSGHRSITVLLEEKTDNKTSIKLIYDFIFKAQLE